MDVSPYYWVLISTQGFFDADDSVLRTKLSYKFPAEAEVDLRWTAFLQWNHLSIALIILKRQLGITNL